MGGSRSGPPSNGVKKSQDRAITGAAQKRGIRTNNTIRHPLSMTFLLAAALSAQTQRHDRRLSPGFLRPGSGQRLDVELDSRFDICENFSVACALRPRRPPSGQAGGYIVVRALFP